MWIVTSAAFKQWTSKDMRWWLPLAKGCYPLIIENGDFESKRWREKRTEEQNPLVLFSQILTCFFVRTFLFVINYLDWFPRNMGVGTHVFFVQVIGEKTLERVCLRCQDFIKDETQSMEDRQWVWQHYGTCSCAENIEGQLKSRSET